MNVYLNELIAFALVIPLSLVFAMFAAAMPRSGGDYVYVSRTLHPALGMMSSFNNTVWWFIYGGVPSAFFARYGLGPFLRTVGDMSGSSTMTSWGNTLVGKTGTVIAGTILIVVLCAIFSRSLRLYFRMQNVLFLFAMASIVLSIIVFVVKGRGDVVAGINSTFGSGSVKGALKSGSPQGSLDLRNTILPMTWLYLELVFNQSSAYIGGEVRRASRVQLWSMPAAAVLALGTLMLLTWAALHSIGFTLWSGLGNDFGSSLGLSSTPVYSEIAAAASGNTLIGILILGGFVFWSYTWLPGQILNASRNLVAYAIDGVMPRQLAYVSETTHAPLVAMWLVGAGSIVFLFLYVYTHIFATLTGIFGFILGFCLVSIAGHPLPLPAARGVRELAGALAGGRDPGDEHRRHAVADRLHRLARDLLGGPVRRPAERRRLPLLVGGHLQRGHLPLGLRHLLRRPVAQPQARRRDRQAVRGDPD